MFGKLANTSNSLLFQLNPITLQRLQMQSIKATVQFLTFSPSLIISSKFFDTFNQKSNKLRAFAHFPNIKGKFVDFKDK